MIRTCLRLSLALLLAALAARLPAQSADAPCIDPETSIPADASTSASPAAPKKETPYRPFSAFAAALKVGTGGIGGEFATPLNNFINLRAGAQVFDHPLKFRTSGIYSTADLTIQNAQASVDIYPFHHHSFHISPGVTLYGDNHLASNLFVPGGSTFLLGPEGYTSDPADPVTGVARIRFGNPVSPRFTIGWGNMLPHSGHFAVPFEVGFQYIAPPTVTIALAGSVCDPNNNCGPVNQGDEATNLQTEIQQLNADLLPLRFYPILSLGFSYKFGR